MNMAKATQQRLQPQPPASDAVRVALPQIQRPSGPGHIREILDRIIWRLLLVRETSRTLH
jgi:hypothetical protein